MRKGTFNDLLNLDLSLFENSLDPDLLALLALIENTCLQLEWERSGSVVECLTRDRRAVGSSLTGVTALCP